MLIWLSENAKFLKNPITLRFFDIATVSQIGTTLSLQPLLRRSSVEGRCPLGFIMRVGIFDL